MRFNGEIIKDLREELGLNINEVVGELYKKTKYATSYQNWQNWENSVEPRGDALIALSGLFKKNIKEFYDEKV